MKERYFERETGYTSARLLTFVLPLLMRSVVNGEEADPTPIDTNDLRNLCVRVRGIGETGRGRAIGTTGSTRYELGESEIIVYVTPEAGKVGDIDVNVFCTYGQVCLRAELVVGIDGGEKDLLEGAPLVFSVVAGGGGADYKADIYMDGDGRVMVERLEDGSTVIFDEHENQILKRSADGTTEFYDAFQSVRQGVTPHGNMWLNMPTDGQLYVSGSMVQGNGESEATGAGSHAEGYGCKATGAASHAEGTATEATGQGSHAEGSSSQSKKCIASGANSHAEGLGCQASGANSHAEGRETTARNVEAHSEGLQTDASGGYSHAEGNGSKAIGYACHAEGCQCSAEGQINHAEGYGTIALAEGWAMGAHAQGIYNKVLTNAPGGNFTHGCGTSNSDRKNAFAIKGAAVYVLGLGGYDGTNDGQEGVLSLQEVILGMVNG